MIRAACLLLVALILGCDSGPELGTVRGTVTLDDKPLPKARVVFQPVESGPSSHAETDDAGHYELQFEKDKPGAVLGEHNVTVETFRVAYDESGEPVEVPETVPAKYNAETTLTRTVNPGEQTIDLKLSSGG